MTVIHLNIIHCFIKILVKYLNSQESCLIAGHLVMWKELEGPMNIMNPQLSGHVIMFFEVHCWVILIHKFQFLWKILHFRLQWILSEYRIVSSFQSYILFFIDYLDLNETLFDGVLCWFGLFGVGCKSKNIFLLRMKAWIHILINKVTSFCYFVHFILIIIIWN